MDEALYARLTSKERDCLRVIGRDLSTDQIAVELNVSPGRAANLIKGVRAKLGGVDRFTAARRFRAYEQSLIGDVPTKDLGAGALDAPPPRGRPEAGANMVREERATFDWQTTSFTRPGGAPLPDRLRTMVWIVALIVLFGACISLAYPMSEGIQHLANLIAPPRH